MNVRQQSSCCSVSRSELSAEKLQTDVNEEIAQKETDRENMAYLSSGDF